jgi:hypothetical protein
MKSQNIIYIILQQFSTIIQMAKQLALRNGKLGKIKEMVELAQLYSIAGWSINLMWTIRTP